jgi:hypothetical protein
MVVFQQFKQLFRSDLPTDSVGARTVVRCWEPSESQIIEPVTATSSGSESIFMQGLQDTNCSVIITCKYSIEPPAVRHKKLIHGFISNIALKSPFNIKSSSI